MNIVVVIPACNEHHTLKELAEGIAAQLADRDYRILFIDDGSTDRTHRVMVEQRQANDRIDVLKFAQNYGKTCALAVAFARCEADIVVTMDADLQDDPAEIPRLLAKLDEGFDLVCGWKEKRHDPFHKTFPSKVYNGLIGKVFGLDIHDVNTGFKAMRGEVARSLTLFADFHRLIPVMAAQNGYRVGEIAVRHHPRRFGQSKYGISRFYAGLRDAARLWFGVRSERYTWIDVDRWSILSGLGMVVALLGVLIVVGAQGDVAGAAMLIVGELTALVSSTLVLVGKLSRAVATLAEDEASLGIVSEEHVTES